MIEHEQCFLATCMDTILINIAHELHTALQGIDRADAFDMILPFC